MPNSVAIEHLQCPYARAAPGNVYPVCVGYRCVKYHTCCLERFDALKRHIEIAKNGTAEDRFLLYDISEVVIDDMETENSIRTVIKYNRASDSYKPRV